MNNKTLRVEDLFLDFSCDFIKSLNAKVEKAVSRIPDAGFGIFANQKMVKGKKCFSPPYYIFSDSCCASFGGYLIKLVDYKCLPITAQTYGLKASKDLVLNCSCNYGYSLAQFANSAKSFDEANAKIAFKKHQGKKYFCLMALKDINDGTVFNCIN